MSPKPRSAFYTPNKGASQVDPSPLVPAGFLGLLPHPGNRAPANPPRPPLAPLPEGWTRSWHAIPAAYPRQIKEGTGRYSRESHPFRSQEPPADETKEQRKARLSGEVATLVETRYHVTEWSLDEAAQAAPPGQHIAVERWRRTKPRGGATIVCTHANGTIKEHWHPVLRNLLARDPASAGYMFGTTELLARSHVVIDDIWMFDEAMHAASADLNAGLLGTAEIWTDLGRDIVNFALHVLPTAKAAGSSAPWQLEWAPVGAAPAVKIYGFGASFGGASQAIAAHYHPEVFEGVLLVDGMVAPRVHPLAKFRKEGLGPFFRARDALKRRDTWPSREDARKLMEQVEFYQRWDREIFELWISHGLVPVDYARPDGEVTLATSPWCEAVVFSEPYEAPRGWDLLPSIRVPVGFLMAHDAERTLGDAITQELVWRPPLARNERATDADHLIVQESPTTVADSAWRFLQTLSAGQWGSGPEEIRASYGSRSLGAKL